MQKAFPKMIAGAFLLLAAVGLLHRTSQAQDAKSLPTFQIDSAWAKLPENMKLGALMGLAVDSQDHVWVVGRKAMVKDQELAAPLVVEFDATGKYVQGWGAPGEGYEWPVDWPHGIFVDYQNNVWICGRGSNPDKPENQILKFTKAGKFLLQIGHRGQGKGSNDTANFGNPADVYVYPKTNEVFVADGYLNRRVIVFDATTGAFKRYWGAYGNKPDDSTPGNKDFQQFATVHQIRISNDGLLYVAVMAQGRIQVFDINGKYLKEVFLSKDPANASSPASLALSRDPDQRYLYVTDFRQQVVHVLNRQTLETLGDVGQPGEIKQPHHMGVDSKGNIIISELFGRILKLSLR